MPAKAQPRRRHLISLTPLIDVVFILLVFFMLASNFLEWRSINLNSPAKSRGHANSIEGSLLLEIRSDGVRLAGKTMGLEALAQKIGEQVRKTPERAVFVMPGSDITLQQTVNVLDVLTAAGASNVTLIKSPGK